MLRRLAASRSRGGSRIRGKKAPPEHQIRGSKHQKKKTKVKGRPDQEKERLSPSRGGGPAGGGNSGNSEISTLREVHK